ncbi:hypothetical protein EH220_00375 [bacterium]|nr:MAG: hypothetical protein EH220_00375 [bacterium]
MSSMIHLLAVLLLLSNLAYADGGWATDSTARQKPDAVITIKEYLVCHDSISSPYYGPEFQNSLGWVRVENKLPNSLPEAGWLFNKWNTGAVYSSFTGWNNAAPPYVDPWGRNWFEQTDEDSWSAISARGDFWELCRIDPDTTGVMKSPRFARFQLRKNGGQLSEFVAAEATRPGVAAAWLYGDDCIIEYRFSDYNDSPTSAPAIVDYHILLNGRDQAESLDYDNGYSVNYLLDKPFFFLERDGKRGYWYDGEAITTNYDMFFHDQCCSPAMWNPYFTKAGFELYAHRDSHWYLVVGTATINGSE